MKKITIIAMLLLGLVACQKEESLTKDYPVKEIPPLAENLFIYHNLRLGDTVSWTQIRDRYGRITSNSITEKVRRKYLFTFDQINFFIPEFVVKDTGIVGRIDLTFLVTDSNGVTKTVTNRGFLIHSIPTNTSYQLLPEFPSSSNTDEIELNPGDRLQLLDKTKIEGVFRGRLNIIAK